MDYRKILVTDGMSNDLLLFMTDAPMEKVVEFMIEVKKAVDNGDNTTELYEGFKAEWLFKVLLDSEMETDTKEMARCIGWDRDFDLSMDLQKGVETMSNLTHLFKVGQKVTYRNNDFDAVKRNIPCIVKETFSDHIIITDTETDTDLWIEEGFNMDCVYPDYNFGNQIGG